MKKGPKKTGMAKSRILIAELKIKISEKNNELTRKKDILLPDTPKPPKKGKIFRQAQLRAMVR
jgi:hypothetical protein